MKLMKCLIIAAVFMLASAVPAFAKFADAQDAGNSIFSNLQPFVYVLGGFAIAAFTVLAIFGKCSFKWLAMICIGLFIVANAMGISTFVTGQNDANYNPGFVGPMPQAPNSSSDQLKTN